MLVYSKLQHKQFWRRLPNKIFCDSLIVIQNTFYKVKLFMNAFLKTHFRVCIRISLFVTETDRSTSENYVTVK